MTQVQTKKSGRIVTTIPKKYAENIRSPAGQHLSWHVESRDTLSAKPEGPEEPDHIKTTQIQYNTAADQYSIAIPVGLAHAMHMIDAELDWDFSHGRYRIDISSRGGENR